MRIAIERRLPQVIEPELAEVVAPRTNAAAITAAENVFRALSMRTPLSLDIAATSEARWFQLRASDPIVQSLAAHQLQVAYPQAAVRAIDTRRYPAIDPARIGPDERAVACVLGLAEDVYLPLRTFRDDDLSSMRGAQSDPVLGILGALGAVPPGCRAISQLVLLPAPPDWAKPYLRQAVEHPLAGERTAPVTHTTADGGVPAFAVLLPAAAVYLLARQWYLAGDWLALGKFFGALVGGGGACLMGVARVKSWFTDKPIYDMAQVREKVSHPALRAQLRLAVIGPSDIDTAAIEACLEGIVAAYGQFALASGNRFVRRRLKAKGLDLRVPAFSGPAKKAPILNARELASLWHLPHADSDVPLLERTGARRILPLPETVAQGCRIGVSSHQGRSFPVCISEEALRRHLLVIAKTGRGKSAFLARLALYVMDTLCAGGKRTALVLVDPHGDLARQTLGVVPVHRRGHAIYLDANNQTRPFGLNLVDVGLGWTRDHMTMMVLQSFKREFSQAWGFRMEAAFRYGLQTLFEANQTICAKDPKGGRHRQYTILDLPALMSNPPFRRSVLKQVSDPEVRSWWTGQFERLNHSFQVEVVFPVQTKIFKFAGIEPARRIVGQPCSTIDPLRWVASGSLVIVNTASGLIGKDAAGLIGDLLLNLVTMSIAQQAALEREHRARAMVMADEIHLMPGADYETLLSEMAKYGASLVLATQSLARLDALDKELGRALRPTIFSNVDGLVVFNTSGEDARYLEQELGDIVNRNDIFSLGMHDCYARLPNGRDGSPLVCSVQLDPPPIVDPETQRAIAEASAAVYGRDVADVDRDLREALDRIEQTHKTPGEQAQQEGTGIPKQGGGDDPPSPAPVPSSKPNGPQPGSSGASASAPSQPGHRRRRPVPERSRNRSRKREPKQASYLKPDGSIRRVGGGRAKQRAAGEATGTKVQS